MATPAQIKRRGRRSLILGTLLAAVAFAAVAIAGHTVNPASLTFNANEGGSDPAAQTFTFSGPATCTGGTISDNASWLSLNKSVIADDDAATGGVQTTVTASVDMSGLTASGSPYSATITINPTDSQPGANEPCDSNLAVSVTLNISANTAPSVTVAGVTGGANYNKGSVPAATCDVTDAEDGNSSFAATLSAITGAYASDGIGQQTASCSYTDAGGLTADDSATYSIVDPSPPSIGYTLNPASPDGANGWWITDVTLTWTVTESESPNSLSKTGCVGQNITADQASTTYSCSASSAGGSAGPVDVTIKRDATPPTISGAASPPSPDGANGWYKTAPTVTFTCGDATSGVAGCVVDGSSPASDNVTLGESVSPQSVSGTATDNAGNTHTDSVTGLVVDLSDPTVASWSGGINDGDSFYFGSVPAAPTCTAADAISGPDGCVVSGYSTLVGTHTLTATATDKAGRTATETRSYTVLPWTLFGFYAPVDMTPPSSPTVWNSVKNGSTVPLKFEVFVGSTELTATSNVVQPLKATQTPCSGGTTDEIELTASGATVLRYDSTAGQFIYNWQTPKKPGYCYAVTVMTLDGSSLTAHFKLK